MLRMRTVLITIILASSPLPMVLKGTLEIFINTKERDDDDYQDDEQKKEMMMTIKNGTLEMYIERQKKGTMTIKRMKGMIRMMIRMTTHDTYHNSILCITNSASQEILMIVRTVIRMMTVMITIHRSILCITNAAS